MSAANDAGQRVLYLLCDKAGTVLDAVGHAPSGVLMADNLDMFRLACGAAAQRGLVLARRYYLEGPTQVLAVFTGADDVRAKDAAYVMANVRRDDRVMPALLRRFDEAASLAYIDASDNMRMAAIFAAVDNNTHVVREAVDEIVDRLTAEDAAYSVTDTRGS